MKRYILPLFILATALASCEKEIDSISDPEGIKYGFGLTLVNNTFGFRDYKVGEVGRYPVCFGSLDYGRNLGTGNGYYDSIGYIEFNEDGTGLLKITEQDSIHSQASFTYAFGKNTKRGLQVRLDFESAEFKTYVRKAEAPAEIFGYEKVGTDLYRFKTDISTYNGNYFWFANNIAN
jgi:hypothetical protein